MVVGDRADREHVPTLGIDFDDGALVDRVGALDLLGLTAVLGEADAFAGTDSFPFRLATASGTPAVVTSRTPRGPLVGGARSVASGACPLTLEHQHQFLARLGIEQEEHLLDQMERPIQLTNVGPVQVHRSAVPERT